MIIHFDNATLCVMLCEPVSTIINYPQGKPLIMIVWKLIHLTDNVNTLTIFLPVWLFVHKSLCSYLSKVTRDQICQNLPHSYAHNVKEWISSTINSSINKLTIITAKSWLVCCYWGLFLRPVRHPWILGYLLSATGWLVQAATLLEITMWLMDDIDHGYSFICNILGTMEP